MRAILNRCLQLGQKVEIIYISKDEKITHRSIFINEINEVNVIGYCYLRREKRTFRLGNILSAAPVKNKSYPA